MIVPDPEDLPIGEILKQDFGGRKFMLFENPSPVLPLHYDKKYLPSKLILIQKINAKSSI